MALVDGLAQPARHRELPCFDGQAETLRVLDDAQMVAVLEELENRVALLDLAFADGPQVDSPFDDAGGASRGEFCPQCEAVELRVFESLVELLVDLQVIIEMADVGEMQCVSIAQFPSGLERAVAVEKSFDLAVIGIGQRRAKPCGAQIRVQHVVLQQALLIHSQGFDGGPVATLDLWVCSTKQVALLLACGGRDSGRAAHKEQHAKNDRSSCVSRQRHRQKQGQQGP